ncbi:MAG: DNA/RNA helicase domain-containing protein [Stenotrophobium sp.]
MQRAAYSDTLDGLVQKSDDAILGALTRRSEFAVEDTQRAAWMFQIAHIKKIAPTLKDKYGPGSVHFEYDIPRMGRRIDVLLILGGVIFVLEYKVGETRFAAHALDQVVDYALDLKNFHETSHRAVIAPVLIATDASEIQNTMVVESKNDRVLAALQTNANGLEAVIHCVLAAYPSEQLVLEHWQQGRYHPTPTIIEAATALYMGHNVEDISRGDAGVVNLAETSQRLEQIIAESRATQRKSICFVTGVPGAGKTLVGLNIATRHIEPNSDLYSVYLSGNGPLVKILHEALARDRVIQAKRKGEPTKKGEAKSQVKAFIQNVHHFRDEGLKDRSRPPIEHVALFDEAQRAWDLQQTASFMQRKKGHAGFNQSEAAFLISCMNRHADWAVIVCLVGGGQEINTGEAGIGGWLDAVRDGYPDWQVYASPNLNEREYQAAEHLQQLAPQGRVHFHPELHLSVSMRSFRAESVSAWVKAVLDGEADIAREFYAQFHDKYPIVLTRNLADAKAWTRSQARGSERYGLVVSSQAQRLKPYAIDVRSPMDPVHWFLNGKDDVRSSFYLEDVATEFHVQGLELDWTCVAWDADFRRGAQSWEHFSFRGSRWQRIRQTHSQRFQLNAYRVLLTRARQGMAILVPQGDRQDPTRDPRFYDHTFNYLRDLGVAEL